MTPLDIDALLAFHRSVFGAARMEDDSDQDTDPNATDDNATDDTGSAGNDDATDADDKGADTLGDAGKQALDRMKERLKKERAARTAAEKALADAKKPTDDETPDLDKIREEARNEATSAALRDRVMDKIEAKAGGKFGIDTEDVAALLLRRHDIEDFLDDGKIDVEAIQSALNDLLEAQPRLAAVTQGDDKKFKGSADGGARGKAGKPQLGEAEVKKLYAEKKFAEIEQARVDGRLDDYLGIK